MSRALGDYRLLLSALILGHVDAILRRMVADGVAEPVMTLRRLLADSTGGDDVARRYGPMVRGIAATFTYQHNGPLVEVITRECITLAGSLL